MRHYAWNADKNEWLRRERGISFEEVVFHVEVGDLLDILEHPNQTQYPGHEILVVAIEGYAYLAPFVVADEEFFLKTIIPSRKATKMYIGDADEQT